MAIRQKQSTEATLLDLVEGRFAEPEFLFLRHVSNGPGANEKRFADGLAINKWSTRGLSIIGFEVKCSRSDWMRELRAPAKAEGLGAYCDFWWLVTATPEIAKPSELPAGWGLYVLNNKGELRQQVKAEKMRHAKAVDRRFMIAVTNALQRTGTKRFEELANALIEPREQAYEEGYKDGQRHADQGLKAQVEHCERLIKTFEQASGIKLEDHALGRVGNLMRLLLTTGPGVVKGQYLELARRARALTGTLEQAVSELERLEERQQSAVHVPQPTEAGEEPEGIYTQEAES
jgi:hypothetical protein